MQVQPYLMFDGRAEEAVRFYAQALGAEVTALMRFKEAPDQSQVPPGSAEKVMHMAFRIGSTELMGTDGSCAGKAFFQGISLSLVVPTDAEAERFFAALSDGGAVQMPLARTFFSSRFGVVADRFGVSWMVVVMA